MKKVEITTELLLCTSFIQTAYYLHILSILNKTKKKVARKKSLGKKVGGRVIQGNTAFKGSNTNYIKYT